jgi:hypothetical protein
MDFFQEFGLNPHLQLFASRIFKIIYQETKLFTSYQASLYRNVFSEMNAVVSLHYFRKFAMATTRPTV